jgi:hypothetical protein
MNRRTIMRTGRTAAVSIVGAAWMLAACTDNAVAPEQEPIVPFAISDEQRSALAGALQFAMRDESLGVLADRDAAARIVAALRELADRVARNDRGGAQLAVERARSALRSYREHAASDAAGLLEAEMLSLTLDHVELLAGDAPAASLYHME